MAGRFQSLLLALALATGALLTGPVTAGQIGPTLGGPLITDPTWTLHPVLSIRNLRTPADIKAVSVDLECGVRPSGDLKDCVVLHESQPDAGLAEAGLLAARSARASPETVRRMEPDGRVAFQLSIVLPGRRASHLPSPASPRYP